MAMSVDGPYGHANLASNMGRMKKVVLIAGGSGAGFLLPVLESLVRGGGSEVLVVVAIRHMDSSGWIIEAVEKILNRSKGSAVKVEIHVTDEDRPLPSVQGLHPHTSETDIEKVAPVATESASKKSDGITVVRGKGRPDLRQMIRGVTESTRGVGVGVSASGLASMMLDVRNECADAQRRILKGRGPREVYLHTEAFSW